MTTLKAENWPGQEGGVPVIEGVNNLLNQIQSVLSMIFTHPSVYEIIIASIFPTLCDHFCILFSSFTVLEGFPFTIMQIIHPKQRSQRIRWICRRLMIGIGQMIGG